MTTNKHIYATDEKIVVLGFVPDNVTVDYAVLVQVIDPSGKSCARQNILPSEGNSFLSRPLNFGNCKLDGEYTLNAYYANLNTTSTFTVSGNQTADGDKLELSMIKNIVIDAQQNINSRLRDLVSSNYTISRQAAEAYQKATSEVSITLQAVELGDTGEAKRHQIVALRQYRTVLAELDEISLLEKPVVVSRASYSTDKTGSDIQKLQEYLDRLQVFYERLVDLSQTNGIEEDEGFVSVKSLLSATIEKISEGDTESAVKNMQEIDSQLEAVRMSLFEKVEEDHINSILHGDGGNNTASSDVTTADDDEKEHRQLDSVSSKLEKKAYRLLDEAQSHSSSDAMARIRGALMLISTANSQIDTSNYNAARQSLVDAVDLLDQAKEMIKDDGGSEGGPSNDNGSETGDNNNNNDDDDSNKDSGDSNVSAETSTSSNSKDDGGNSPQQQQGDSGNASDGSNDQGQHKAEGNGNNDHDSGSNSASTSHDNGGNGNGSGDHSSNGKSDKANGNGSDSSNNSNNNGNGHDDNGGNGNGAKKGKDEKSN